MSHAEPVPGAKANEPRLRALLLTVNHESHSVDVEEVWLEKSPDGEGVALDELYRHIGCEMAEAVYCAGEKLKRHVAFVDENGIHKQPEAYTWCKDICATPLAGRVLILKGNGWGGSESASATVAEVSELLRNAYITRKFARSLMALVEEDVAESNPDAFVVRVSMDM